MTHKAGYQHEIPYREEGVVLYIPDLHWRDIDKKAVRNWVNTQNRIYNDLINIIASNNVTHIIQGGDWCDQGYRVEHMKVAHNNKVKKMSDLVNGNLTMCLGNHFYLERDYNPEMYWIQPNDIEKPLGDVEAEVPLVKTPDEFMVGPVRFVLQHFQKSKQKDYYVQGADYATYTVAIYHDHNIVPYSIVSAKQNKDSVKVRPQPSNFFNTFFENVNHAIYGHIHTPYPTTVLNLYSGKRVRVDIPGSCICTNKGETHEEIKLPLYRIKEGRPHLEYVTLNTHRDMLDFTNETTTDALGTADLPEDLRGTTDISKYLMSYEKVETNYVDYLRTRGVSERHVSVYKEAASGTLDITKAVKVYVLGMEV